MLRTNTLNNLTENDKTKIFSKQLSRIWQTSILPKQLGRKQLNKYQKNVYWGLLYCWIGSNPNRFRVGTDLCTSWNNRIQSYKNFITSIRQNEVSYNKTHKSQDHSEYSKHLPQQKSNILFFYVENNTFKQCYNTHNDHSNSFFLTNFSPLMLFLIAG